MRSVVETAPIVWWWKREDFLLRSVQTLFGIHFAVVFALTLGSGGSPAEIITPGQRFAENLHLLGALRGVDVLLNGEWWRLLTAIFAHFGLIHLFFNSMALNAVQPEVERNLGRVRFLFVFLGGGLMANALSLFWNGLGLFQVGASGAICALIGALYMIARMRGGTYDQIVTGVVKRWVLWILVFGFLVPGVDNVAHIGGMIAGALLARIAGRPRRRGTWVG
jgi:rhomboid protease GluP